MGNIPPHVELLSYMRRDIVVYGKKISTCAGIAATDQRNIGFRDGAIIDGKSPWIN
jgi:hypothetical protein